MRSEPDQSRQLTCSGCGGRFRITPKQGRQLPPTVACPTCETPMPVENRSEEDFWVSRSYAEIFHRNPALAAPVGEESDDEKASGRREEGARGGGVRRTSRTFRDVGEVHSEREKMLDSPGSDSNETRADGPPEIPDESEGGAEAESAEDDIRDAQFEEVDRQAATSDLDDLEEEFSFIAAEAAEDVAGTPLPLPVEQPSKPEADLPDLPAADEAPEPQASESRPPEADESGTPTTDQEETEEFPRPAEELVEGWEEDDEAATEAVEAGDRRGGRVTWLAIIFAILAAASLAVAALYVVDFEETRRADADEAQPETEATATPEPVVVSNELDAGTDAVERDVREGPSPEAIAAAVSQAGEGVSGALELPRHARRMLERGHPKPARHLAIRAMVEKGVSRKLRETFDASIRKDDNLTVEPVTIGKDVEVDTIQALGGGWSITLRLTKGGRSMFAFKPSQRHWEEGWRAEVASYRLCEIVACHFEIPRNRPARVTKEQFETLYGKVENEDQAAYERRFDDLIWRKERGPDGEMRSYLYGTLKDWVPGFAKWPIEYEQVWHPWVDAGADPALLEQRFSEAIAPYKQLGEENFYEDLMDERGDATTRSVARQLSTIVTFDFLVSNWDRYSTAESYYGVNNQFADGEFVSIDNGAALPAHHFRVVGRRLQPVTRFSRSTVASIRALRPEVVDEILFPNPSVKEESRLDVFWQQRDRFLDRINGLIAEYGRKSVLYFR